MSVKLSQLVGILIRSDHKGIYFTTEQRVHAVSGSVSSNDAEGGRVSHHLLPAGWSGYHCPGTVHTMSRAPVFMLTQKNNFLGQTSEAWLTVAFQGSSASSTQVEKDQGIQLKHKSCLLLLICISEEECEVSNSNLIFKSLFHYFFVQVSFLHHFFIFIFAAYHKVGLTFSGFEFRETELPDPVSAHLLPVGDDIQ